MEFVTESGEKVFQTGKMEKKVVLQIGAPEAITALRASELV